MYVLSVGGWRRILEYERNEPQTASELTVAAPEPDGTRTVLITGMHPACASRFNVTNYRAFRIGELQESPITLLYGARPMVLDGEEHGVKLNELRADFGV
jgi:hypothetical protein